MRNAWMTVLVSGLVGGASVLAQGQPALDFITQDSRGEPELVICSQNLENYGLLADTKARIRNLEIEDYQAKEKGLVQRFISRRCDVIALQELLGFTEERAQQALDQLTKHLRTASNRYFTSVLGKSNDKRIRTSFLVADDRASILGKLSYVNVELPKIVEEQKQRYFARGPLELQLQVKPLGESYSKVVTVVNFHFKSKSTRGGTDPTGLEFEPYRMEMAEAIRRIVESRHSQAFATGQSILVLTGDRNSHFDSASARILEGTLTLGHFQGDAVCRLSKRGLPLCKAGKVYPQRLFSVLTLDPQTKHNPGTMQYKKVYSWLDDLLLPAESLPFAWASEGSRGNYDSGVDYHFPEASDHGLVWVKLNW